MVLLFQNILGGAVFGVWVALPLVCLLSACGASLCYLLSLVFGCRLVTRYLGHRLAPLQDRVGNRLLLEHSPHCEIVDHESGHISRKMQIQCTFNV